MTRSRANARSGVSHSRRTPGVARCGSGVSTGPSQAANVLPDPVGACSSPDSPFQCARHISSWKAKARWSRLASQSRAAVSRSATVVKSVLLTEQGLQAQQCVSLARRLVGTPALDAREAHRDPGFVAG